VSQANIESVTEPRARAKATRPAKPKARKQPRRTIAEIEEQIHALESQLAELGELLADPPADWRAEQYAAINGRQETLSAELSVLYAEWERVSAEG
jgi:hypothetical protein